MTSQPSRPSSPTRSTTSSLAPSTTSDLTSFTRFFGCYLLVSRAPDLYSAGRTYVGFTVNPPRRLKQHNGLLKYGGAKRTSKHRPWQIVAVVHGFASHTQGLQFEWAWQNPLKSVALRLHGQRPNALGLPGSKKNSVGGRMQTLAALLSIPPWNLCPLTITICLEREYWEVLGMGQVVFPKEVRVKFDEMKGLHKLVGTYEYRHDVDAVVPHVFGEGSKKCAVCEENVSIEGVGPEGGKLLRLTHCSACGVLVHLRCLASCRDREDLVSADVLLPNYVQCKTCNAKMHWSLAVRLARALSSDD